MKVLTANRLEDGAVVYLTPAGSWSMHLTEARILKDDSSLKEAERQGELDTKARLVVAHYAFDIEEKSGRIEACSMREKIRADHAPTIKYDQGSWQGRTG